MKYRKLVNVLKSDKKTDEDYIYWKYYGYGILINVGNCKVKDIPIDVKLAKCFRVDGLVYYVDGAL